MQRCNIGKDRATALKPTVIFLAIRNPRLPSYAIPILRDEAQIPSKNIDLYEIVRVADVAPDNVFRIKAQHPSFANRLA